MVVAFAIALGLVIVQLTTGMIPQSAAFFGTGCATLVGCLALIVGFLDRCQPSLIRLAPSRVAPARSPLALRYVCLKMGIRNAPRHPGRSTLTIALIACATFIITALQAFRLVPEADAGDIHSGTGGFALIAESQVPLQYDASTRSGRESLNIDPDVNARLDGMNVMSFRLRPDLVLASY